MVMPKVVLTVFTMPNTGASLDIQTFPSDLTSMSATLAEVVTARHVQRYSLPPIFRVSSPELSPTIFTSLRLLISRPQKRQDTWLAGWRS